MKSKRNIDSLIINNLDYLYHLAFRLTGCQHTSEDIVQEVFLNLSPKDVNVDNLNNPKAWLATVLYRTFVRHWRREKRSPLSKSVQNIYPLQSKSDNAAEDLPANGPGPAELTDNDKMQQSLSIALDRLSEEHRTVVILHDVEGYTLVELEQITATPIGTLKSRLHRARSKLQNMLNKSEPSSSITPHIHKRL